jgi:hypothetical protein
MPISVAKAGIQVTLAPATKSQICFDIASSTQKDITPNNILTVKKTIPCKGEQYPAFAFKETDRVINGLFLDLV